VFDIGGGIPDGKAFKAVQIGGPSGGCLPSQHLDLPIDYDSLIAAGAIVGSGGMIVMDEETCMVDTARYFMNFVQSESCGKCTPCRIGTRRMLEILTRITEGDGKESDIELLSEIAESVKVSSLCALGQTAPNSVLTTIRYFREEYEAHISGFCPSHVCTELFEFRIDPEKCKGCGLCKKNCPQECISGERKQPHEIDPELCIKCGVCFDVCPFDAVLKTHEHLYKREASKVEAL
jgi:NADP-reducing hydrogenase subunit HndC